MGLISSLLNSLEGSRNVSHPCTNCESDCKVCPDACDECKPYKEKLVDILYNVDNIEAFRAKYEVVSETAANVGSCTCPACGAPNPATAFSCEFCGTLIKEPDGKIRVTSANDIPNPILEAQELIFERSSLVHRYSASSGSEGILSAITTLLNGDSDESTLGSRMTEDEIKETAEAYGVSVSSYLQGLDNGKYLTYEAKQQQNSVSQSSSSEYATAGAVGLGALGIGNILGTNTNNSRPPMPPQMGHRPDTGYGHNNPPGPEYGTRPGNNVQHQAYTKPQSAAQQHGRPELQGFSRKEEARPQQHSNTIQSAHPNYPAGSVNTNRAEGHNGHPGSFGQSNNHQRPSGNNKKVPGSNRGPGRNGK